MAILLSLVTAISFGSGDFFGGLAAKRASVLAVVGFSHLVGLVGVVAIAPFMADVFTWRDFGLGAAGGILGGTGVALLYKGLARGPMAVVAPLTAITSAAIPSLWGVVTGDSVSWLAWVGIALALLAIGMVSTPADNDETPVTFEVVVQSLLAGTGFGLLFILFDATDPDAAPWPVVGARVVTTSVLITLILFARREDLGPALGAWPLIVLTGLFDTGSNVMFLVANGLGSLTIVAVLSSLYPVATVVLARFVLNERMSRFQLGGLLAALGGTVLISWG